MSRATIIAITTAIWTAGFTATGAFVYDVTQPLPPPGAAVTTVPASAPPPAPRIAYVEPERTIELPSLRIVGSIPRAAPTHAAVKAPDATPASQHERHCSDWRPLEQGSASVQICD